MSWFNSELGEKICKVEKRLENETTGFIRLFSGLDSRIKLLERDPYRAVSNHCDIQNLHARVAALEKKQSNAIMQAFGSDRIERLAFEYVNEWEKNPQADFTEIFAKEKLHDMGEHLLAIFAEMRRRGYLTRPKGV